VHLTLKRLEVPGSWRFAGMGVGSGGRECRIVSGGGGVFLESGCWRRRKYGMWNSQKVNQEEHKVWTVKKD